MVLMVFSINTTSDYAQYHERYLWQIPRTNSPIIGLYYKLRKLKTNFFRLTLNETLPE